MNPLGHAAHLSLQDLQNGYDNKSSLQTFYDRVQKKSPEKQDTATTREIAKVSTAMLDFTKEIALELERRSESFCLAPASLAPILAVVFEEGLQRSKNIANFFNKLELKNLEPDRVHVALSALSQLLVFKTSTHHCNFVNSCIAKPEIRILDSFKNAMRQLHKIDVLQAGQLNTHALLVNAANVWTATKTKSHVQKTFDVSGNIDFAIMQALHFKGIWHHSFDKKNIIQRTFYGMNGSKTEVNMVQITQNVPFYSHIDFDMIEIGMKSCEKNSISELYFLPKENRTCKDILSKISLLMILASRMKAKRQKIAITLPKIHIEYQNDLLPFLKNKIESSPCDDLPGVKKTCIKIDAAMQKICIFKDFEKKETGNFISISSESDALNHLQKEKIALFIADRPFIYVIMKNDQLLFLSGILDSNSLEKN